MALLRATPAEARLVAMDVDPAAFERSAALLADYRARVIPVQGNFRTISEAAATAGFAQVDAILADLGVSSDQLADPAHGLSFERDDPLDMRLDPRLDTTAAGLNSIVPASPK